MQEVKQMNDTNFLFIWLHYAPTMFKIIRVSENMAISGKTKQKLRWKPSMVKLNK